MPNIIKNKKVMLAISLALILLTAPYPKVAVHIKSILIKLGLFNKIGAILEDAATSLSRNSGSFY